MAADVDKQVRFVELRGKGVSYLKICEELGVSERSLVRWSREFKREIGNQRALELERLREEYLLGREQRIRIAGSHLGKITEELLKRDLSEVPTHRLFDMERKLVKEIADDSPEMEFVEDIDMGGYEAIQTMLTKEVRWKG